MDKKNLYKKDETFRRDAEKYIHKLFPEDLESALRFYREIQAEGYNISRIDKFLSTLVSIKKRMVKPFEVATKEDITDFVIGLEKSDYREWTKHDQKLILRKYMRWLGKEDTVDWIKVKKPKNRQLPEETLSEEEIKAIASSAYTTRDKAFVLTLYESGSRIGELLPLKMKHVSFDQYGAVLRVTGRTGGRRIRLVAASLPLQRWIDEHPAKNNPEAYLWCKIPVPNNPKWTNGHLCYGFVVKVLKELAAKAGVKKKVNPHAFRHARATFMAKHLKEPEMREFFGWSKDSEMPSIYVHLSGRDIDNAVLGVYGFKEAEESRAPRIKVEECPRCQEKNVSGDKFCKRCGLPFGQSAQNMDRVEELMIEFLKVLAEEVPGVESKFREAVNKKGMEGVFFS